jgi:hypothetical protein
MKTPEEIRDGIIAEWRSLDHLPFLDQQSRLGKAIAAAIQVERRAVWNHTCVHHNDAEREAANKQCPVCAQARIAELEKALEHLMREPYGCPMCDSGKLRNQMKPHWPDCPYVLAAELLKRSV